MTRRVSSAWKTAGPERSTVLVQTLVLAGQLVADLLMARFLGPDLFGVIVFALGIAGAVSVFVLFGTGEVAIQMYGEKKYRPQTVWTASMQLAGLGWGVATLLALAGAYGAGVRGSGLAHIFAATFVLGINAMGSVANQAVLAKDLSAHDIRYTLISRALLIGGTVAGALLRNLALIWLAYGAAAVAQLVGRLWVVHRHGFALRWRYRRRAFDELWGRGHRIGVASIFGTVSARADLMALRLWSGVFAVGAYGAIYRWINAINFAATAAISALYPKLSRGEDGWQRAVFTWAPRVGALVLLMAAALTPSSLVVLLLGEAYAGIVPVMRWLFFAAAFQVVSAFTIRELILAKKERRLPFVQAAAMGVGLVLLPLLVPVHGVLGAAWATVTSEITLLLGLWWVMRPGRAA